MSSDNWVAGIARLGHTSAEIAEVEKYLAKDKRIRSVTSYIGDGAPRFILTFPPEKTSDDAYGLILVSVKNYEEIDAIIPEVESYIHNNFPDAAPIMRKFALGPSTDYDVEARFSGPDAKVLRQLSEKAKTIMRNYPYSARVWDDWRPPVKKIVPVYDEVKAKQAGISRPMLAQALETSFTGTRIGVYREGDKLIPIVSRLPKDERLDVANLSDVQVWSPAYGKSIPITQVVSGFKTTCEDSLRMRYNRKLTISTEEISVSVCWQAPCKTRWKLKLRPFNCRRVMKWHRGQRKRTPPMPRPGKSSTPRGDGIEFTPERG